MGAGVGAYSMMSMTPYHQGSFLCCLWSMDSNPTKPRSAYTREIPLTSLNEIYEFNQREITFPVKSVWLSVMDNTPFLVIETR